MHGRRLILQVFLIPLVTGCFALSREAQPIPSTQELEKPATVTMPDATSPPYGPTRVPEITPHVSPYVLVIVEAVEIHYLKTNPLQVELVIRGTLPDQCKYEFYSIETRQNHNVRISLSGIHPSDYSCKQINQTIEYLLPLGRDMQESQRGFAPGNYELVINNYKTNFSIK